MVSDLGTSTSEKSQGESACDLESGERCILEVLRGRALRFEAWGALHLQNHRDGACDLMV